MRMGIFGRRNRKRIGQPVNRPVTWRETKNNLNARIVAIRKIRYHDLLQGVNLRFRFKLGRDKQVKYVSKIARINAILDEIESDQAQGAKAAKQFAKEWDEGIDPVDSKVRIIRDSGWRANFGEIQLLVRELNKM